VTRVAVATCRMVIASSLVTSCAAPVRVGSPCGGDHGFTPFDDHPASVAQQPADDGGILDTLVAAYQDHGRARDPGGCRFAPSCSAYARQALGRYGPIIGVVLIVDRLFIRENGYATAYYPLTCVDHATRLDDAIP